MRRSFHLLHAAVVSALILVVGCATTTTTQSDAFTQYEPLIEHQIADRWAAAFMHDHGKYPDSSIRVWLQIARDGHFQVIKVKPYDPADHVTQVTLNALRHLTFPPIPDHIRSGETITGWMKFDYFAK